MNKVISRIWSFFEGRVLPPLDNSGHGFQAWKQPLSEIAMARCATLKRRNLNATITTSHLQRRTEMT